MKHQRGIIIILLALVMVFSLACGLTGSQNNSSSSDDQNSSSSSSGGDDVLNQFSTDINTQLIRTDKKNFKADQFLARSLPIEVTFNGTENAEVIMAGALARPNYTKSRTPPDQLQIYLVLKRTLPSFLIKTNSIYVNYWDMNWTVNLLDIAGNLLGTFDTSTDSLYPNYSQAFESFRDEIPDGVEKISLVVSMTKGQIGISCFTDADLNFQFPFDVLPHSPIQIHYQIFYWNEEFAEKGVMGSLRMHVKNDLSVGLSEDLMIYLLDENGKLAGVTNFYSYVESGAIDKKWDTDYLSTTYLSAIPSQALVVFNDVEICDLIVASR